jgi:hypothetical protein
MKLKLDKDRFLGCNWQLGITNCGKTRRKETSRKTTTWWEDNNGINLREIKWGGMDWIDLAQNRDSGGRLRTL